MDSSAAGQRSRKPRSDGIRNYQLILEVAKQVVAGSGPDFTLEEVSRRSKVGIGTVYRHFPTKLDLSTAIYNDQLEDLLRRLKIVGESHDQATGLLSWLREVADRLVTYQGLVSCFDLAQASAPETKFWQWKTELLRTGNEIVQILREEGRIRPGVSMGDLLGLVNALAMASGSGPNALEKVHLWLDTMEKGLSL